MVEDSSETSPRPRSQNRAHSVGSRDTAASDRPLLAEEMSQEAADKPARSEDQDVTLGGALSKEAPQEDATPSLQNLRAKESVAEDGSPSAGGASPKKRKKAREKVGSTMSEDEWNKILDEPKVRSVLPADTWGIAIFVIVKDLSDIFVGRITVIKAVRAFFGVGCSLLNLYLQFMLLHNVGQKVVIRALIAIQYHYRAYHSEVFLPDGSFDEHAWEKWDLKDSICNAAISRPLFLGIVILLWTIKILQEIRLTMRLLRTIRALRDLPAGAGAGDMVVIYDHVTGDGDDENTVAEESDIIALTRMCRAALYIFVVLPKFVVALYLLYTGTQWLSATESFEDLIMNALALGFVLNVDEYIYNAFFPPSVTNALATTRFAIAGMEETMLDEDQLAAKIVTEFWRTLYYLALAVLWVVLNLFVFVQVLPNYKFDISEHCQAYVEDRFTPKCFTEGHICFPFGSYGEVFKDAPEVLLSQPVDSLALLDPKMYEKETWKNHHEGRRRRTSLIDLSGR